MLRVALKGLLGHKLRFLLTAFAVVLGVTFVVGSFVLTDSMEDAFGSLLETAYEGSDLIVRVPTDVGEFGTELPGSGPSFDEAVLATVTAVDGVAEAVGYVEGSALFVDGDGEPMVAPGAPSLAFSWSEIGSPLVLRDGSAPVGPDDVTMDAGTAESGGFTVGDEVEIVLPSAVRTFTVTGITGFGETDNLLGASIATFDLATAQRLFDEEGRFDEVAVVAEDDTDVTVLRERVADAVGNDLEVITVEDQIAADQADVSTALGFFNTALLAFAGVALFVGAFIVVNTFSIVVAQRTREFALLRAVGASARQIRLAVLLEATAVGVVSSLLGLGLGVGAAVGLRALLGAVGLDLPASGLIVAPRTVVVAVVVGVGVTVVAALGAARRAARIAPVEAMRGAEGTPRGLRRRTLAGLAVAAAGVALLTFGLVADVEVNALALVGSGALVTLVGVALLAPLLAEPVARVVGALPARSSVPGRLAQRNARSQPRRTATTASALMIGLALVTFVTVFSASIRAAVSDTLSEQFRADFLVSTEIPGLQGLPTALADDLAAEDALGVVSAVRWAPWVDGDDQRIAAGVDPATVEQVVGLDVDGDPALLAGRRVLVQRLVLADRDAAVGDTIVATFTDAEDVELEVVGTFENADLVGAPYVLAADALVELSGSAPATVVYANAAAELDEARAAVDRVLEGYPGVTARDQAEFREEQDAAVSQVLALTLVLLALAVVIALLGIANTLALTVFERTREIGLLRAVGMTRRQTRRMVTWESVIVAVFGALLGLAVGSFFGWAVVRSLREDGVERFVLPGGQLVLYLVVAGVAGVVAAVFPAWRAARLDVLEAVTTE